MQNWEGAWSGKSLNQRNGKQKFPGNLNTFQCFNQTRSSSGNKNNIYQGILNSHSLNPHT